MVRPRQFSDADLLSTARELILEHGPGVSTSVIADAAGVSQATLFKRFGTKKELMIRALVPDHDGPGWELVARPLDDRPIPEQLEEKGRHFMAFFHDLQPRIAMLRACGADMLDCLRVGGSTPPPVRALREVKAFFDAAVAAGRIAPVPTEALALTWLGALRNRSFFAHMMPELQLTGDDATYVHELTTLLWKGLRPPQETR